MTTRTVHGRRRTARRRPRALRRNRQGFWHGFRHATHTDHLRARVGGATGRAVIRAINKRRTRKGKPPIPQRGGDWYTLPKHVRPFRPARPKGLGGVAGVRPRKPVATGAGRPAAPTKPTVGQRVKNGARNATMTGPAVQTKGQAAAAGAPPAFSGPHVRAGNGKASQQAGSGIVSGIAGTIAGAVTGNGQQATSVTGSGVQGPGNRGAGASTGVPAYGTGGAGGDGDHMISPGSAGGSATGGAPAPPGGIYGPHGGEGPGPGRRTRPAGERPPAWGGPSTSTSTHAPGGSTVSTMPGIEGLAEAPETDAEYVAALRGVGGEIHGLAERVQEVQASLLEVVGMDSAALGAYDVMAEGLTMAAEAANQAVTDFLTTYAGVIETAQSGVKIPGGEGRFFTGDVS